MRILDFLRNSKKLRDNLFLASEQFGFGPISANRSISRYSLGDQKGQVAFLISFIYNYELNGLPKNGFFVDLATGDGITKNNTLFLEKHLGWTGLLIEPNPVFHDSIRKNRSNPLIEAVVASEDGRNVQFRLDNGHLGGVIDGEADNRPQDNIGTRKKHVVVNKSTRSLASILDEHAAPSLIDFLSLDVEGYEHQVLKDFPFDRYRFRAMAVERPTPTIDVLLDAKGYVQVAHLSFDVIYVHRNFLPEVNFKPNVIFSLTPRKRD